MVIEIDLFEQRPNTLKFLFVRLKREVYKRKVDTRDELLDHILYAAACEKRREYQPRRTKRDLRTRVANCTEVYGRTFEHLLRTVTNVI